MNTDNLPYKFHSYEPGVFVELYLPKKARYQGTLYNTLTDGFNFNKVKEHFLADEKRTRVYQMLKDYTEIKNIEDRINDISPFYWGYSLYEVDGVFFNPQKGIIEEKTQVVRIMFLPDLAAIQELAPTIEFTALRRAVKNILRVDKADRGILEEQYPQIADYISKWKGDIGLFLFGYIIFELCSRIKSLNDDAQGDLEDEIWLTSFWNLEVNKVKLNLLTE